MPASGDFAFHGLEPGPWALHVVDAPPPLRLTSITEQGQGFVLRDVACGTNHTLAVDGDGAVWSWGKSDFGKCGHGDDADCKAPARVAALAGVDVVAVACGESHSLALDGDGVGRRGEEVRLGGVGVGVEFGRPVEGDPAARAPVVRALKRRVVQRGGENRPRGEAHEEGSTIAAAVGE